MPFKLYIYFGGICHILLPNSCFQSFAKIDIFWITTKKKFQGDHFESQHTMDWWLVCFDSDCRWLGFKNTTDNLNECWLHVLPCGLITWLCCVLITSLWADYFAVLCADDFPVGWWIRCAVCWFLPCKLMNSLCGVLMTSLWADEFAVLCADDFPVSWWIRCAVCWLLHKKCKKTRKEYFEDALDMTKTTLKACHFQPSHNSWWC